MMRLLQFRLILFLSVAVLTGCATQAKVLRPDWQNADHGRVREILVSLLPATDRDPIACSIFFLETDDLQALSLGDCIFGFSTGVASTGDDRLIRAIAAHEVAHQVLGHADKRKAAIAAIATIRMGTAVPIPVISLAARGAALAAELATLVYSRSQEAEADEKALEILRKVGDADPAGTMVHAFRKVLAHHGDQGGGLLDTHPGTGERLEAMRRHQLQQPSEEAPTPRVTARKPGPKFNVVDRWDEVMTATTPLGLGAERPTYTVGQKWIRSDGVYRLTRIDKDLYIFSAGPGQEIHLNKDLMVTRMQKGGWVTEFDSLPKFHWPLGIGKKTTDTATWQVPQDPTKLRVKYTWSVDAYEEIQIPAGTFKAFRIVLSWEPLTVSSYPGSQLVLWYAPEVRQFVKGEGRGLEPLTFEVTAVDRSAIPPLAK